MYECLRGRDCGRFPVGVALLVGVPLGLIAAYRADWVDDVIMRVMDALIAFPPLLLALGITSALHPGLVTVMIAIGIVSAPRFARLVRGQALSVRATEYVAAARVIGAGSARLIARHIWPNVTAPIIVQRITGRWVKGYHMAHWAGRCSFAPAVPAERIGILAPVTSYGA